MISHPFAYDGIVISGEVALNYLKGSWLALNSPQSPLLNSFSLVFSRIFGFSYYKLLIAQFLFFIIIHFISSYLTFRFEPKRKHNYLKYLWISLAVMVVLGVFRVVPGGLNDFRRDLISSLLLGHALMALPLANFVSFLLILFTIIERFHCLPVIALSSFLYSLYKRELKPLFIFVFSFLSYLVFRWQEFFDLVIYYRGHVGVSDGLNVGIASYLSRQFYTYYPWVFLKLYLGPINIVVLLCGLLYFFKQHKNKRLLEAEVNATNYSALIIGSLAAIALLTFDKTRNNEGVLRYFVIPLSLLFSKFIYVHSNIKFLKIFALIAAANTVLTAHNLAKYDYKDMQVLNFTNKSASIFDDIYNFYPNVSKITAASNFTSDLNFTPHQWYIYLATNRLPLIEYDLIAGRDYVLNNERTVHLLNTIKSAHVLFLGNQECNESNIPSSKSLYDLFKNINSTLVKNCKKRSVTKIFKNCFVTTYICNKI